MESGGKNHIFASPPLDETANKLVEENPRFPIAVKAASIINYAGGFGGALACLLLIFRLARETGTALDKPVIFFLIGLMPVILLLVLAFRGLIWYNIRTTVPNPSVSPALLSISIGLLMHGVWPSFQAYLPMLKMSGIIAVILWIVMLFTTSEFKLTRLDIGNMIALLFIVFIYSYGAFTTSNVALDNKEPQSIPVAVTNKEYDTKGDNDYHEIAFTPVPGIDKTEMEVTESFFKSVEIKDTIYLNIHPGRWGSAYFSITKQPLR
jgi:hypothetical protein